MDREKVINEFEAFVNGNCPSDSKHVCHIELMETVLALLKEQQEENERIKRIAKEISAVAIKSTTTMTI